MYKRSPRPKGDNSGTSVNLVRHPSTGVRGGMGGDFTDFLQNIKKQFTGDSPGGPAASGAPASTDVLSSGTSTTASDFNSTKQPGTCIPTNHPASEYTQTFQKQLNRVARAKGFSRVAVDGFIGPGTMALFKQVQAISGGAVMGDASSCMGVAPDVDVIGDQVKQFADSINAPEDGGGPLSIKPPAIVNPATGQLESKGGIAGGLIGAFSNMGTVEKLAVAGAIGGVAYFAFGKKRRK